MSEQALTPEILRLPQVQKIYGLSRSTIYREIARGNLPPPIRISSRCSGWRKATLDECFKEKERQQAKTGTRKQSAVRRTRRHTGETPSAA